MSAKRSSRSKNSALQTRLRRAVGPAASFLEEDRFAASFDGSKLSFMPEAVIRPRHREDIGRLLKLANRTGTPVTVRGAGSSLTGSASPLKGGWVLDLSGWASISNQSGKTYNDAMLRLIAGQINRAQQPQPRLQKGMLTELSAAPSSFQEKAFFEYHMYTLPRKATLADKEIKQISLFDPATTAVQKIYKYMANGSSGDVEVAVKFMNTEKAGLGMPLPGGRVRMFKADTDGSLILLGEDQIDHTPKDEELSVTVGTAFDIVAEERLVSRNMVSQKVEDQDYEIEIRNHKSEPVTVEVDKNLYGFWEITKSNLEYMKKDANTVQFDVPVKAEDTTVVSFTVRITVR